MIKKKLSIKLHFILIITLTVYSCKRVNNDCNQNRYKNAPNKEWFRSHDGTGEESHGHFILNCSNGGYLQVGETGFVPKSAKILVIKTDNHGNLQWKKEFGTPGNNLGNSAIELENSFVICGAINENSTIIELDKIDGSLIYQESYDNGGTDAFEHVSPSPNGFIAVGYINAQEAAHTFYTEGEGFITFLDSNGLKQSEVSVKNNISHAYRIKNIGPDYIISGLTQDAQDYALLRIDNSANIIWTKTFGGSNSDHCFGMDISTDDFIFLTGHTLSGTENWDTYTMKIDHAGNLCWEVIAGNPRGFDPKYIHDEAWGIKSTDDGGCLVVAGTGDEYGNYKKKCGKNGDNSNLWHVYLIKYDSDGSLEWQKTFAEEGNWAGEDVDLTSDGGAIVAVDNSEFGFLKIGPF